MIRRRAFVGGAVTTALTARNASARSRMGRRQVQPHVVVIGGGAGGATAARHLAEAGDGRIAVTLIETHPTYQSCFFSNHYIGGFRDFASLTHSFDRLICNHGIAVVHERAKGIDLDRRKIVFEGGTLDYDRLVVSPGIDFVDGSVNGWSLADAQTMPHAYRGGSQTQLLKQQIKAMPQGGVFGMVVPAGAYRCPPGPYERATVIAHWLKRYNPTAKIIIADPKPLFSKMPLFRQAWKTIYNGMIDMNSDVSMDSFFVDPNAMTMTLDGETIGLNACNVIPAQIAGEIAINAGLTEGGWAPVHAHDMRSRIDDNVFVLGDAALQGDMPKSAYSANSQARVCAEAVLGELIGAPVSEPRYRNTCWSLLEAGQSVKIGATYRATSEKIEQVDGFVSKLGEGAEVREATYAESLSWYDEITTDMFG